MNNAKVLIVEDEGIVQLGLMSHVAELDYPVAAAVSTGESAIQQAARTQPDVALMDIRIKGSIDGIETASILHTRFHIPVIFVSPLKTTGLPS